MKTTTQSPLRKTLGICLLSPFLIGASPAAPEVAIHLIDDVSGPELAGHGIKPAAYDDIEGFADILLTRRLVGSVSYDVIDDNGADNQPLCFRLEPFSEPVPEPRLGRGMTVVEKRAALKEFEAAKDTFLAKYEAWKKHSIEGCQTWIDGCVAHRVGLEKDFLQQIQANQDRDFRRSDIIGSVQQGNAILAEATTRFLILNTDMSHQPGKTARDQVVRALNHADLAEDVTIILVNRSGEPNRSELLRGIPHKILRAETLTEAADLITAELDP